MIKRSFLSKGVKLGFTLAEWTALGFPARQPEEVKTLFKEHCLKCPLYDPEAKATFASPKGTCRDDREFEGVQGCGCHVSPNAEEWSNAVTYPNKPCPRNLFPLIESTE